MKKCFVLLLTVLILTVSAAAEETPMYAPPDLTQDEVREFMELLFTAAAGTTAKAEKAAREEVPEEELAARNLLQAEYRAKTLTWLKAVLNPDTTPAELCHLPDPQNTPSPTETPETETTQPIYAPEDAYAAFAETEPGREYLTKLATLGGETLESGFLITQEICGKWKAEVDHEKLAEMNGDYRCWIYNPGTQIDYPVVQSEDNSHYLKRMFNGDRNSAGTLFIDYRNLPDFQDPNTLIYGHHMRNNSMFGTLTDYYVEGYYEAHPFMVLMKADEVFLLEIFAGYVTDDKDHCYDIAISDEADMQKFLEEASRKSDFGSCVQVQTTDRLVTLSTCAYAFEDARYIVIGRIVPVWERLPEDINE